MDRVNFLDKLPHFYDNGITRPILKGEEEERNILFNEIEDTLRQFFVETATWGLEYWERMLEIKTNQNKSYAERRSIVLAKMKVSKTSTVEAIRQLCLGFFNVTNAYVHEDNANYSFYVELENPNFSINTLKELCDTLNTYKPAHLNYSIIFAYRNSVTVASTKKTGLSKMPICNTFYAGTWWKSFNEGSIYKGTTVIARSKAGYSKSIICGIYRSNYNENNAVIGQARVGLAKVGRR